MVVCSGICRKLWRGKRIPARFGIARGLHRLVSPRATRAMTGGHLVAFVLLTESVNLGHLGLD
jgi:hypothetical protein